MKMHLLLKAVERTKQMDKNREKYVNIKRQPSDSKMGTTFFRNLKEVHWDNISGGVHARSGQYLLYGYIYCNQIIKGEISHSCAHGPAPHKIKVFIPIKDNDKDIIMELKKIADEKGSHRSNRNPYNVADKVRELVAETPGITPSELYKKMPDCPKKKIKYVIRYLKKYHFKKKKNLIGVNYKNTQKLFIKTEPVNPNGENAPKVQ